MTLTRRSVALLAVAAVLAVLNLVAAPAVAPVASLPSIAPVAPGAVVALEISTPIEKLRVERVAAGADDPGRWRIVTPLQVDADATQVQAILRTFADGVAMEALADRGNLETYGVADQEGLLVELFAADAEVPVASVVVGKTAAGPEAFVRLPGAEEVYRADIGGRARFARPAADWRDRTVLDLDPAAVVGLSLSRPDLSLAFARPAAAPAEGEAPAWRLTDDAFPVDAATVAATVDALARVRAVQVHNPDYDAGLDAPAATATLTLADGGSRTLVLGARSDARSALVRVSGRDEVFRVPAGVARALAQPAEAFRDRRLLSFAVAEVGSVALREAGLTVVLSQDADGAWAVTQPPNLDADQAVVLAVVNALSGLRAVSVAPDPAFAPSGARLEVRMRDGRTLALDLGQGERDAAGRELVRVRASGREGVYLLEQALLADLRRAFGRG